MIARIVFVLVVVLVGQAVAQPAYPVTRSGAEEVTIHGLAVPDPYRWLESIQDQEVKDWRDSQNEVTKQFLARSEWRSWIRERLDKRTSNGLADVPDVSGGRYVWLERHAGMEQSVLMTKMSGAKEESILVDPNKLASDGSLSIAAFHLSQDGNMLAYRVRSKGTQNTSLHIKSTVGDRVFAEVLHPTRTPGSASIGWVNSGTGFYYVKEVFIGSGEKASKSHEAIFYHVVGTPASDDKQVYGDAEHPTWRYQAKISDGSEFLIVRIWERTGLTDGVMMIPLKEGIAQPSNIVAIAGELDTKNEYLGFRHNKLLMRTNFEAPNGRVVEVDLDHPERQFWKTTVAERSGVINDAIYIAQRLVVSYTADASSTMLMFDADGGLLEDIKLPGLGRVGGFLSGDTTNAQVLFSYSSTNQPHATFVLDLKTRNVAIFSPSTVPFDSAQFTVRRVFVTARDGTNVPVFLAHRSGMAMDGNHPVMLTGYGGFGVSQGPRFVARDSVWLEMGGVVAIACVRGGGEYGKQWHEAGMLMNKKNAVNDFVDVAQWLVDSKYTSSHRLATVGVSTGGLLVSAALNAKPNLFGAVVNGFGITDLIRNESAKTAFNWTDEFGSVANEKSFTNLLSYSPQQNILGNVEYPAVMVMAAEFDDRVLPWHQFKLISALQNKTRGTAPKLLRVTYGAGHVYGRSATAILDEGTDVLTFIADSLGLKFQGAPAANGAAIH